MTQTLLVGNFGDQNVGDELILLSALQDYPGAIVMTSDAAWSQNFTEQQFRTVPFPPVGLRSFWKYLTNKNYRSQISQLANYSIDKIVFPGGGLLAIKWKACWLWFGIFCWLRFWCPAAQVRLEHQGVDQHLSWFSQRLAKYVFGRADFISVRDPASGKALEVLGIKYQVLGNDRVYDYLENAPACPESDENLIILNALSEFDITKIETQYPDHKIIFVPFALSDISVLPDDFAAEVIWPKTKTELFELMQRAEVLIGERFHSLVLGAHFCGADKTFTLKAPYSEKVESFCAEQGILQFKI